MTPTEAAPDLVNPVIGWRAWGWTDSRYLTSQIVGSGTAPFGHYIWHDKHMTAECMPTPFTPSAQRPSASHVAPGERCFCGLYAYHEQPSSWTEVAPGQIRGLVKAWGEVMVHLRGFRAQYMEILAINFPALHSAGRQYFVREVAAKYDVPLVSLRELGELAELHNGRISKNQFI